MLTDRSLAWLSSKRLKKQLTETDADTYTQALHLGQGLYGGVRGRVKGAEGDNNSIKRTAVSTDHYVHSSLNYNTTQLLKTMNSRNS